MQNIRNAISDSSYQFGWPQLLVNRAIKNSPPNEYHDLRDRRFRKDFK